MRLCRATVLLLLAVTAFGEPVSPRVVERYKQMLAANPVEGLPLERLWKGAVENGTTDALIAEYRRGGTFASELILGHLLRKAGRDDEAADAYGRAVKLDPSSAIPLLALGALESNRAHPRQAAEWLEKALPLLPKDDAKIGELMMQLGGAWSAAGDLTKAVAAWDAALERDPGNMELRRRMADACADNNLPDVAIRHLEFLVEHADPTGRAQALQQIAKLHSGAGRPGEAMKALERAVGFTAPGNWLRPELLGQIVRLAQRQHAEAKLEQRWREQVDANPRDLGGYVRMVEFHERMGNLEQQRAWLEKITGLVPGNAEHELRLARLLEQMDHLDDAAIHFDRVLPAQPRNTDLVFERARLDLRMEDGAAARKRITGMLAARKDDETLRPKAIEFCQEHRLLDLVEELLRADAAKDGEEGLLALANFYFSQRRNDDARSALGRLFKPDEPVATAGPRRLKVAQILKGQGELTPAIAETEAAVRLQPGARDARLLLGDLRLMLRQFSEARVAYEVAHAASATEAEKLEVDGKLFESFRSMAQSGAEGGTKGDSAAAVVEGYIRELMGRATAEKSSAGWLRVARWKAWNGDKSSAVTFAAKAADMEPKNPAPREFLASHSAANGDGVYAVVYLRELIELNPAGRDGYLREIARLELLRGNSGEALSVFAELAAARAGDADALADLASAQERAGKMKEAAVTWRKVMALMPAPRRREAGVSLIRVLEQLGLHEEAAGLMLRSVDETQVDRDRLARFDELLLYCQRHGRLAWLRGVLETRHKARAGDYFSEVALGRVLKTLGEKDAAFQLFADAIYAAPNQAEALPELVREAEELRQLDVAVRLQEQFTRVAPHDRPDGFLKLAELQERTGDLDGTGRTWDRAVAKFPRDAEVLRKAADFHDQWGERDRAATLLRKLGAIDPANVRAAADLGELEFGAGRPSEARAAFETVMKLTRPITRMMFPSERGDGPWSERGPHSDFRMRREWSGARVPLSAAAMEKGEPPSNPESGDAVRLNALRRLGEIARLTGGVALDKWISEWSATPGEQPTEALWALYFSGAREQALTMVGEMAAKNGSPVACRQAFIWMALESGLYGRLGKWLNMDGRTGEDAELFTLAFAAVVKSRPEAVGPGMMDGLFPGDRPVRMWPSAMELARNRRLREALSLGYRMFEAAKSQRPGVGRDIARWHLALGELDEARSVLTRSCESEGDSFESVVFSAMRDLYFLLPVERRAAFVEKCFRTGDPNSTHGLITRVLFHGIEGRTAAAMEALGGVLGRRALAPPGQEEGNSAVRGWNFAAAAAGQLSDWNLPHLALSAWDSAFSDDGLGALMQSQLVRLKAGTIEAEAEPWAERSSLRELVLRGRDQRDTLRYLMGGKTERAALIGERLLHGADGELTKLGEALGSFHGTAAAVEVFRTVWERDPQDAGALRRLLDACRSADDPVTAEAVRRRCLDEGINPGNDSSPREFALELSNSLEERGAADDALRVIERALERNPGDMRIMLRQAQLFERKGRAAEAGAVWLRLSEMDGGTAFAVGAIETILEQQGKLREAIALRVKSGASGDAQLPSLYYRNGQTDEALAALERLTGNGAVYAAMTVAEASAQKGDGKLARSVLVRAAPKAADARSRMQIRSKLLTIPGLPPAPEFVARMQVRLRELSGGDAGLSEAYFEFFDRHAGRFGMEKAWVEEVEKEWADGAGPVAAGVAVLRRQCARSDAAAAGRTCGRLLARAETTDATIEKIAGLAAQMHRPELRLRVAEAAARRSWPMAQGTLDRVALLDAQGNREEARRVLEAHSWIAGFSGGAEALGRSWLALGDPSKAREFLGLAIRENVLAPSPPVLAAMARVHLASKNVAAARLLLRRAFADPSCGEVDALVEYLGAAGELGRWRKAAEAFGLSGRAGHQLKLALFSHFETHGRLGDALGLLAGDPGLIVPVGAFRPGNGGQPPVDCERLRSVARRTGDFAEVAEILERLAGAKVPDAASELAALYADWAATGGDRAAALPHLERAAGLRPASWEFSRRAAEILLERHESVRAGEVLVRFLSFSQAPVEREAAFDLWEKAGAGSRERGSPAPPP